MSIKSIDLIQPTLAEYDDDDDLEPKSRSDTITVNLFVHRT